MNTSSSRSLSVRELGALGSASAVAIVAWLYFPSAFMLSTGDVRVFSPDAWQPLDKSMLLRFAAGTAFLLAVIELAYRAVLARFMWREFRLKADERDRIVAMRARSLSYRALVAGSLALTALVYVSEPPGLLVAQYVLLMLCAGEFVKYAATFILYRSSI